MWKLPKKSRRPSSEWILITPAIARAMLACGGPNRPRSPNFGNRLVHKMKEGKFLVTGQGIGFTISGNLCDGQHRLTAVVKSGTEQLMLVSYNLPEDAIWGTDVDQKPRSAGDLLFMEDPSIKNRSQVASCARLMLSGLTPIKRLQRNADVKDFAVAKLGLIAPFLEVLKKGPRCVRQAGVHAAFCAAVRQPDNFPGPKGRRDRDQVMVLVMRLSAMDFEGRNDPLNALVRRLDENTAERGTKSGASQLVTYSLAVSAIRSSLAGDKPRRLVQTTVDWGDKGDRGGKVVRS